MLGRLAGWLARMRSSPAALSGAPVVRRIKTYSAVSGYVYEYFYEGHRDLGEGREYVFSVSADRVTYFPVSVVVTREAVEAWQTAHARELSGTERYAAAKMALRQAFDERARPNDMHEPVRVRPADLHLIAETLELD